MVIVDDILVSMMCRLMWPFLLMYGSHDMRHTVFHRLTVVNGTPWNWGVTYFIFLDCCSFDCQFIRSNFLMGSHLMMPFSTGIGLERVDSAGPELGLLLGRSAGFERWTPLQKQERKRIDRGSPVTAPRPKLVPP